MDVKEALIPKMNLWLLMITIIILFGVLSVAFILSSQDQPLSSPIQIPAVFYLNTFILLLSSLSIHLSWTNLTNKKSGMYLGIAIVTGIVFLIVQVYGWMQMYEQELFIQSSNKQVAFLYLLSGLHGLHILGAILFLIYVAVKLQKKGSKLLELGTYFWHFLGVLWIYLLSVLNLGT